MGKCKLLGGGTNIGKYVWRKSEIVQPEITVTNPTFSLSSDRGVGGMAPFTYTLTSTGSNAVDFTQIEDIYEFLDEVTNTGQGEPYFHSTSQSLHLYTNSRNNICSNLTTYPTYITFQANNYTSNYAVSMFYDGTKIVQSLKLNPLGFVIGSNAEQYPSNGEQRGYWYELIGQITSTNALSLTDDVTDTVKNIAIEEVKQEVTNAD